MVSSLERVRAAQARLNEVTDTYAAGSSKVVSANAALLASHANANKASREHADAMAQTEAAHNDLATAATGSAAAVGAAGKVFNAVGVGAFVGLGGTILETTKSAANFQQQITKLGTAASVPADQLKTLSDGVLQLAGQVGYSTSDLNNAMFTIAKGGFRDASEGLNVLRAAAQGANAEGAPLEEVVNALTTSLHDFHLPADQAAGVMSKMVTAVGLSKVPLQDFAGALHTIEPTASQLGLNLSDLWGVLAQVTQSGTSADQAADQINNALRSLSGAQAPARQAMQQLGLDADDISQKLGQRGLAGTLQYVADTLASKIDPSTKLLDTGELLKSTQAVNDENEMLNKMSPAAKQAADALRNHTMGHREYTMAIRGANEQDAEQLKQFQALDDRVEGFSKRLSGGRQTLETYNQALNDVTGTQSGAAVALQTTGEHAQETNDKIQQIETTYTNADGTVKGFNETQGTLNAKMRDAHAAFGAAAAEIGEAFVPIMTDVANIAKTVGDELAKHPGIAHNVVTALEGVSGAWLAIKSINIVSSILSPIVTGLGSMVAEEDAATEAAGRLSGALSKIGKGAALGVAAQLGGQAAQDATQPGSFWHSAAVVGTDAAEGGVIGGTIGSVVPVIGTGVGAGVGAAIGGIGGLIGQIGGDGHAHGGAVHGRGPKGIDSVLTWLAPGEHVLTHHDVARMGGHPGVYAMRNALHRQYGGEVGPDVQVAESMVGTAYSQGSRTDCSGMVGRVVLGALGLSGGSLPTTKNMGQFLQSLGFRQGYGGPGTISVGWYDHGGGPNDGHAAMTLSDGENAESGGSHGNFIVGAGAAGANNPEFDHHMFLPNVYGQGPGGGGGYGGAGGVGGAGGFGGGIPAGGVAGTGPGGQQGYYMANPQRVGAANERLRHLDAEIANAEQRRGELKADAKQSERDRLDEEIRHLKEERAEAEGKLQEAQRGTFHAMRGGRGRGGVLSVTPQKGVTCYTTGSRGSGLTV